MLIQRLQAQARGGVAAGAEGQPRVQPQLHPSLALALLPLGDHQQPLPDLHGLIKLLPVVLPVGVLHGAAGETGRGEIGQQRLHIAQLLFPLGIVGEIKRHAAQALFLPQKLVVHIVPILVVIFQKILEIRLVVNDQTRDPRGLQAGAEIVQLVGAGVDMYLDPVHRWVPTKKMPMVLGPVWLPMTGPM